MAENGTDKSEKRRKRILDATLACYVKYGWSGTNMSVIARHVRMTRGMIQYYFPTLEDILHASVAHLNSEWRKKYFTFVEQEGGKGGRLDVGIDALWRLMKDPLHVARQEVVAAARSNESLRALLRQETGFDEASTLEAAKQAYPDLARVNETAFRRALDYTVVFLEGLSRHQFSDNETARSQALLEMVKKNLADYWREQGIEMQPNDRAVESSTENAQGDSRQQSHVLDEDQRDRALALVLEAASILSAGQDSLQHPVQPSHDSK